jgi:hypothetical protein
MSAVVQAARQVAPGRRAEFALGHLTFALIAHSGAVGFQLIPHQAATPSARRPLFDGIADADLAPTLRQIADVLDSWLRETAT